MMSKRFQFHTGSIKSVLDFIRDFERDRFQFHTGSIKSSGRRRRLVVRRSFNSTLVRLKGLAGLGAVYAIKRVSIPHWFD